jgi:hypothetical protein
MANPAILHALSQFHEALGQHLDLPLFLTQHVKHQTQGRFLTYTRETGHLADCTLKK